MLTGLTGGMTTVGILVAAIYILVRLVEFLIKKAIGQKSVLLEKEKKWLEELYDWHNAKDQDGLPKWYVPRDWSEMQKELGKILTKISSTQERTTYVLEGIVKQLEVLTNKIEHR